MTAGIFIVISGFITALVQVAKKTDGISVDSHNAKFIALVVSAVSVLVYSAIIGVLDASHTEEMVTATVAMSTASVGIYESFKSIINTVKKLVPNK